MADAQIALLFDGAFQSDGRLQAMDAVLLLHEAVRRLCVLPWQVSGSPTDKPNDRIEGAKRPPILGNRLLEFGDLLRADLMDALA